MCISLDTWGCSFELNDGEVLIYEWPSCVHSTVAGSFLTEIATFLGARARDFRAATGPRCGFDGFSFEPDAAFTPLAKPNPGVGAPGAADADGNAFPNLVLEVAFGETLPHAQTKAAAWLGPLTSVQQVIIIKIGKDALANGGRTLLAFSYLRGMAAANLVQTIDFSYPANQLVGAGVAGMQLFVPLADLYFGDPGGVPAGMAGPAVYDLFWIQRQLRTIAGF